MSASWSSPARSCSRTRSSPSLRTPHPLRVAAVRGAARCSPARSALTIASVDATISDRRHVLHHDRAAVRPGAGDARHRRPTACSCSWRRGTRWRRDRVQHRGAGARRCGPARRRSSRWRASQPLAHGRRAGRARWSLPLLALTLVYFVLNSGLTAMAVGLESRPVAARRSGASTSCGCRSAILARRRSRSVSILLDPAGQPRSPRSMVLPLLAVFHLTLRSSFGRLDDARRHLARHRSPVSVDGRNARDGDRRQGRRDAQPRAARAGVRDRSGARARRRRTSRR